MGELVRLSLLISCLAYLVQSGNNVRIKRAGSKVRNPFSIRPPFRLAKQEPYFPPPGWTHCIRNVVATSQWRAITSSQGFKFQTTQFQCTWMISLEQNAVSANQQIQISVRKLSLGNKQDKSCRLNFLEIIDTGKTQGRFCDFHKPGDYVTIGDHVRLDVQGEGGLANLVRTKGKNPFIISYRGVTKQLPGERSYIAQKIAYDKYHPPSNSFGIGTDFEKEGKKRNKGKDLGDIDNEDDDDDQFGSLGKNGVIGLAVLGGIVLIAVIVILLKKYCGNSKKEKTNKDKPDSWSAEEGNFTTPQQHSKVIGLPGHPCAPLGNFYGKSLHNEVILISEITSSLQYNESLPPTSKKQPQRLYLHSSVTSKAEHEKQLANSKMSSRLKKTNLNKNRCAKTTKVISAEIEQDQMKNKIANPKKFPLKNSEKHKRAKTFSPEEKRTRKITSPKKIKVGKEEKVIKAKTKKGLPEGRKESGDMKKTAKHLEKRPKKNKKEKLDVNINTDIRLSRSQDKAKTKSKRSSKNDAENTCKDKKDKSITRKHHKKKKLMSATKSENTRRRKQPISLKENIKSAKSRPNGKKTTTNGHTPKARHSKPRTNKVG